MPSGGSFAHRGDRRAIVWCLLVVGVTLVAGLELGLSPASLGQSHLAVSNRISTPAAGQSLSGRSVPPPSAFANGSGTEIPTWVNLSSSVGIPMYVQDPLLTFDPARDGIILAGGTICLRIALGPLGCPQAFLSNATWEFRGGHWSNITDEVGPCPKGISSGYYQGFLVYDPLDGYLVLWDDFGRTNAHGYFFFPQTWILGDSVWTNITGESPPQPGHAGWAVYDPVDSYLVYLDSIGDTWKFAGGVWTRLGNWSALNGGKSVLAPAFQQVPEMAWDPAADQVLLYGGGPNLNQTWTFVGGGWTEANGTGPPPRGTPRSRCSTTLRSMGSSSTAARTLPPPHPPRPTRGSTRTSRGRTSLRTWGRRRPDRSPGGEPERSTRTQATTSRGFPWSRRYGRTPTYGRLRTGPWRS